MKYFIVVFMIIGLVIPTISVADDNCEIVVAADRWAPDSYDWREQYIQQVDRNVKLNAELEDCEHAVVDGEKGTRDKVAIAVAAGVFIGSGGVSAIVPVVGGIIKIPFLLLGF